MHIQVQNPIYAILKIYLQWFHLENKSFVPIMVHIRWASDAEVRD